MPRMLRGERSRSLKTGRDLASPRAHKAGICENPSNQVWCAISCASWWRAGK
jgi:hypothetical protein